MLPHTKPDRSLTPWGAQQQLGLLVKDPVGKIARVVNVNNFGDCHVMYLGGTEFCLYPCRVLRPHPVPLTYETAHVGQWVREIRTGKILEITEIWDVIPVCYDSDNEHHDGIEDFSELEALPPHCQLHT